MDDLPVKHPGLFHPKITLLCKTLDFYLKLLLLLENVKHNQSLTQRCPVKTEVCRFPNFTSEAGSPFFFKLPTPDTPGHTQHYQLSLADGDSTLPHWMVFRKQTGSLSGLALIEDCGIYHLKMLVIGDQRPAFFYLHILNRIVTDEDSERDTLSCSEGEISTWVTLLLQLNPVTLDASQRTRLVSTVADYLRLPPGFVYLFSRRKSFMQQQERLRVCRRGEPAEEISHFNEEQDSSADVAQVLWRVGCQREERQYDLVKVLEQGVTAGGFARLLDIPVLEWRVLCASRVVQHKVRRDLQRLKLTPTPNMIQIPSPTKIHQTMKEYSHINSLPLTKLEPSMSGFSLHMNHTGTRLEPTHADDSAENVAITIKKEFLHQPTCTQADNKVFTGKKILTTLHTSVSVEFGCSHPNWFSDHNSQEYIKQAGLSAPKIQPHVEASGCSERVSEVTSDTSLSISEYFWTTELFYLPFMPEHKSTVRTFVEEPPADTAPLLQSSKRHGIYPSLLLTTDSHSVAAMVTHEAVVRKSFTTRLTLQPHPKETVLWTGAYRTSPSESESAPTVSSMGDTIYDKVPFKDHHTAKPTLQNLPSVSHPPPAVDNNDVLLLNSRLKTIQSPRPSNKIPSTQLFPDVSPTSYLLTQQLPIPQHSDTIQHLSSVLNLDAMSQLSATTQNVSSTTLTGQLTLSGPTELESSLSVPLLEPSVLMFTPALPSELGFFSGQLETPSIIYPEFTVESLKASSSMMPPLQTTYQALHMSLPLTVPLSVFKPFNEQPSVQPSMQLLGESQQTDKFSHISLVAGMTTSMYLNTAVLTTIAPSLSVIYPAPPPVFDSTSLVSEDHFDPTAPSAVQEPYTTSFIHQTQNLDPSYPLCGQYVPQNHIYVSGCTPQIKSTYLESTVEHVLDVFTGYSQDEKYWTSSQSPFLMSDSSGQFFSIQTSDSAMQLSASTTTEINHETATPQADISLEDSSFSVITYKSLVPITSALSGNCVSIENSLLICQTDSSGTITKGSPTQQILSTSLSPFYGISTTLLTSLQAGGLSSYRRQSTVQPTSSSASISSSVNLPPKVLQSIPVLTATVGFPFHYSIPPKTFLDTEDGDADALSLEIRLIDGPPISVGSWLALDGLELHGVPLEVDLQFAPQHLRLAARDRQGLSSWLPLTLDLRRSPVDPCHVFTLTAQRSLHSILRQRHRVELLLRKLSHFFNSSSNHQLSVVSMRPGSTVVSWYNYSLCGMGHNTVRQCHIDQIQSMWLAMRSADGSVSAVFKESMLPEFPITKVGPVSYRQDCFPTTSTPIFDSSTPAVHTTLTPTSGNYTSLSPTSNTCVSASPAVTATSQQMNYYQWMAGMFTALLVVCLLILTVLLVAAVLHFCKGRGRSRTVAIWPASRVLTVQSRDLRAIRPRRPPVFQPELPPPPLRLWINLSQGDEGPSTREQGRKTPDKALQACPPKYDYSSI